jgi:hypothetical protein
MADNCIFDQRTEYFIEHTTLQPHIFHRLPELKVDPVKFVQEYRKQNPKFRIGMDFILYGFKYNEVFNQRLGRPEGYPTWKEFVLDCLQSGMEKFAKDIDKAMGKPVQNT